MKELLVRTISGAVLVAVIVACVLFSVWSMAALALFIVIIGTYEMGRLQHVDDKWHLVLVELIVVGFFLTYLLLPPVYLLFVMASFLLALFTKKYDYKSIAAFVFGSIILLGLPCSLMVRMHQTFSPQMVLLIFVLLWTNDTFAYLSGRLLGKHKLFERISPGKTIEGSIGGLVFTMAGVIILSHYVDWLSLKEAVGMGLIAVVFGTLGDLCESMLKRQAGVKDSGNLIPGHGGILDRFDSVLFAVPFVFVYLLLL
jgi:phosphatidate cytidylyltransferase